MYILLPWVFGIILLVMAIAAGTAFPLPISAISFLIGFVLIKYKNKQNKKDKENKEKNRQERLLMQKNQAAEEESLAYTEGLKKYSQQINNAFHNMSKGSEALTSLGTMIGSSAYQEKEKDWAIHGGIASGIAGPIAGVVTALNVMQENSGIRKRNAENQAWAKNQERSFLNSARDLQNEKHALIKEERDFLKTHRASFSKNPEVLFSCIEISDKKIVTDECTGAVIVHAKWTVFDRNLWIDGALRAKLYSDEKELAGYAYLVFPKEGTSKGSGYLSGICPCPRPAKNYNIVIEPVNLWEIVRSSGKETEEIIYEERKKSINKYERNFKQEKKGYLNSLGESDCSADSTPETDEKRYNEAVQLMNDGDFQGAISVFEEIGDYKDSQEKLAECDIAILDGKYNNALRLIDAGNITEAYRTLTSLGDYKNSKEKLNSIKFKYEIAKYRLAKYGDSVFFGTYEQDNDETNGKEKLEWIVLDKQDGKILVVSKLGLCYEKYNSTADKITWENCSLRKWLNNDFINTAFTEEEKSVIPTVTVSTEKSSKYRTVPGNDTQDKVFVLSIEEARKYFDSDRDRVCIHTEYSAKQGCPPNNDGRMIYRNPCWWWLRSPGNTQDSVAVINGQGVVIEVGYRTDGPGGVVRPAMWIDLKP